MKPSCVKSLGLKVSKAQNGLQIRVANGSKLDITGIVGLEVDGRPIECYIAPITSEADMIIGFPFMKEYGVQFDYDNRKIRYTNDVNLNDLLSSKQLGKLVKRAQIIDLLIVDVRIRDDTQRNCTNQSNNSFIGEKTEKQMEMLNGLSDPVRSIITKFSDVFPMEPKLTEPAADRKTLTQPAMRIDTGDADPIKLAYYKMGPGDLDELKIQLKKLF